MIATTIARIKNRTTTPATADSVAVRLADEITGLIVGIAAANTTTAVTVIPITQPTIPFCIPRLFSINDNADFIGNMNLVFKIYKEKYQNGIMRQKNLFDELEKTTNDHVKDSFKSFPSKEEMKKAFDEYYNLSFDNMKRRATFYRWILEHKYHVRSPRKLGNFNRVVNDKDFMEILPYVRERFGEKQYLALEFEGIEGPRGEDTVRIKTSDLDFIKHSVRIFNRKAKRWYEIPLNPELELELKHFILSHGKEIQEHHDYVFFSSNPAQKRDHLSEVYLRRVFREASDFLGLSKVYETSIDGRKLHLDTLHGLRGHAATRIYEKSGHDLTKVQELLDHRPNSLDVTMLYLEKKPDDDLKELI